MASIAAHPSVTAARRAGTIAAFEIGGGEGYLADIAPRLTRYARENNVLLRPLGDTVYVMPPYCIDEPDLDVVYAMVERFLDEASV